MNKETTPLEALETIRKALEIAYPLMYEEENEMPEYIEIIEKELILLNALRNKLNRKVETKEYKYEESNGYRIATLLTYELKEQWNDKELQALKQFLLNLSGISKELKALEIIKEKEVDCNTLIFYLKQYNETGHIDYAFDSYNDYAKDSDKPQLTKEEYSLLKGVLL